MSDSGDDKHRVRKVAHRALDRALTALVPSDGSTPFRPAEETDDPEELFELESEAPELVIEKVRRLRLGGPDVLRKRFAFPSPCRSSLADNNTVRGYWISPVERPVRGTLVFLHGWKATSIWRLQRVARHATDAGVEVLLPAHPYHAWRRPKMTYSGVTMLSPDLDRTLQAIRQSVLDVRSLLTWVQERRQGPLLLAGLDLGGLIAALVATVHERLDGLVLIATYDRLSELLWEGRADKGKFRDAMDAAGKERAQVDRAWSALDPSWREPLLPKDRVMLVEGRYDTDRTNEAAQRLSERWGDVRIEEYNFAHADFSFFSKPVVHDALRLVGVDPSR